jgi:hypothetical protein
MARQARERSYPVAGRTAKISITVAEDVLRDARGVVRRKGGTLSGYVSDVLAREMRLRRLQELLDRDEAEDGPIPEEELRKARERWPV